AEDVAEYEAISGMPADEVVKLAKKIERDMLKAARDLQFEQAARLRDKLLELRQAAFSGRESEPATAPAAAGASSGQRAGRPGRGGWRGRRR
ncbi:MAG TPA: UvrB/UvrC motif-containing protein, partial [Candidatus Dormibacteraeota bacterium]|nr:UvrB/UvrC motif-containing protein [Candidatus Dormibacteraeota bacterium]